MKIRGSLRLRVTLVCTALLALCCLLLTLTNNFSAMHLADAIQATPVFPAQDMEAEPSPALPMTDLELSQPAIQARQSFHTQSLLAMAAIVAAGSVLIYWGVGKALAPLHELTRQIRKRTADDLDRPVDIPNHGDEVWELACSFNQMSERLNQVFVMQKNFSHNAAHEFRTPLAIMKTRLGLYRKKVPAPPPETAELVGILEGEVDRLSSLVGDLLDLTNLEDAPRQEPVEVEGLLRSVADEVRPLAGPRQVAVAVDVPGCTLRGNRQLLHRALFNLVENAVKYSPTGGTVEVSARQTGGLIQIQVTDQGPGIPEECRQQIFEPFFRVDRARSRRQGGTGLGLALVRAIAQFHGGSVRAEPGPNGGSRFVLELPLRATIPKAPDP